MGIDFKMTDNFMFQLPRKILFGNNSVESVGKAARELGTGNRVFLVTDKGVANTDLLDKVIVPLEKEGYHVDVFDKAMPDAPISIAVEGAQSARSLGSDIVIGLGGGSSLDTAKAISFMVHNDGDIRESLGINKVKAPGLPKIFIPTTAGTGSELSHTFVLYDEESGDKVTSYSQHTFADIALIDPTLTLGLPPRLTAESGIDALSHALESFVTIKANPLSDLFSLKGVELISQNLRKAYAKGGDNLEARYAVCFGVSMGTMAIRSSGVGAVHATCYPIASKYGLSHGVAIALMMPHVMKFNLIGNLEKYAAVAKAMGEPVERMTTQEAAEASVTAMQRLISDIGLTSSLEEVGGNKDDFSKFADLIMKNYGHHIANNPRIIEEIDLVSIYESAL